MTITPIYETLAANLVAGLSRALDTADARNCLAAMADALAPISRETSQITRRARQDLVTLLGDGVEASVFATAYTEAAASIAASLPILERLQGQLPASVAVDFDSLLAEVEALHARFTEGFAGIARASTIPEDKELLRQSRETIASGENDTVASIVARPQAGEDN
jgi:hypothetical protein